MSLMITAMIAFSSCLTTKQTNLLRETGTGDIPAYQEIQSIGEYTIKPGDEIGVMISVPQQSFQTEALFSLFTSNSGGQRDDNKLRTLAVGPDGFIYFPYLKDIYVAGKTTLQIQQELETRINRDLLVEEGCIVHVYLANRYFSVIGESSVGRYPIAKEQLTIFQALSQSKDIKQYGNRAKIKIIRQTENGSEIRTFDLRSEDIVNSAYYYVQPNDVIYVEPLGRQFWGVNSFASIFAIISTLTTLGVTIYNLTK